MNTLEVKLKNYTPLEIVKSAIRTCWDSGDKSDNLGPKDLELIKRVGVKYKHESTLEHAVFNFEIKGISRLCLIELTRHRIASYSVKSTRYTLKELRDEPFFLLESSIHDEHTLPELSKEVLDRASRYVVLSSSNKINIAILQALDNLITLLNSGISIDSVKYALPECYKTNLYFTINLRSLRNLLKLRSSKSAHFEIQNLAKELYIHCPQEYMFLLEDCIDSKDF